jgi:hypothetical protein
LKHQLTHNKRNSAPTQPPAHKAFISTHHFISKHRDSLYNAQPFTVDQDGPTPQLNPPTPVEEEVYNFHFPPLHPKQQRRLNRVQLPSTGLSSIPQHRNQNRNTLTFATINTNGLRQKSLSLNQRRNQPASNKRALLHHILNSTDICALQETHLDNTLARPITHQATTKGTIIFNHGTTSSCGVGLFFSHATRQSITTEQLRDTQGCILIIKTTLFQEELEGNHL